MCQSGWLFYYNGAFLLFYMWQYMTWYKIFVRKIIYFHFSVLHCNILLSFTWIGQQALKLLNFSLTTVTSLQSRSNKCLIFMSKTCAATTRRHQHCIQELFWCTLEFFFCHKTFKILHKMSAAAWHRTWSNYCWYFDFPERTELWVLWTFSEAFLLIWIFQIFCRLRNDLVILSKFHATITRHHIHCITKVLSFSLVLFSFSANQVIIV